MAECFNFCNTFYCVRPGDNGANEHEESRSQTSSSMAREERIKEVQDDAVVELMVTVDDAPVSIKRSTSSLARLADEVLRSRTSAKGLMKLKMELK